MSYLLAQDTLNGAEGSIVITVNGKNTVIAGMRNMQAQSLNNAGCCGFQRTRHWFKRILNEELARIFKFGYLVIAFINIGNRHGIGRASAFGAAVFFGNFRNKFAAGF